MNKVLLSSSDDANKLKPIYRSSADGIESISFGTMNKKLAKEFTDDLKNWELKKKT